MSALLATLFPESFTPPSGKLVEHRMDGSHIKSLDDCNVLARIRIVHPKVAVIKAPKVIKEPPPPKQRTSNVLGFTMEQRIIRYMRGYILSADQVAAGIKKNRDYVLEVLARLVEMKQVEELGKTLTGSRRSTRVFKVIK